MEIILNKSYGTFSLSDECAKKFHLDKYDDSNKTRTNPALIAEVEENPDFASGTFSSLYVVNIPDEATDYEINEYDGYEEITYVLNGRLYHS